MDGDGDKILGEKAGAGIAYPRLIIFRISRRGYYLIVRNRLDFLLLELK